MDKPMTDTAEETWSAVRRHFLDPSASWNIGTFGAIAEFHRDADEPATFGETDDALTAATARGGLRVLRRHAMRLVPYEGLSALPDAWLHGVMVCLPEAEAATAARAALAEIGPDVDALQAEHRGGLLFDLGLGAPHLDACVRTRDEALVRVLRANSGRSLFDPANPAMPAIKEASPHRVFVSRLGRVEVYQHIGSSQRNIPAPDGPHTHVLPDLLRHRRTHAATVPVPAGWLPSLAFFPANPVRDRHGDPHPFDPAAFAAFEGLLAGFGDPQVERVKQEARNAVRAGRGPDGFPEPPSRAARAGLRVALRQLFHTDGSSPALTAWRARFDRANGARAVSDHGH
jgi:hypothetical protein